MIKTILWDFDGVILDSMKIKGDGFVELFGSYDREDVKKIEKYHYENGGVSRFDKIRYFYKDILNKNITEQRILQFSKKFTDIIEKKMYNKKNLIQETIDFIILNYQKYNFHIVSGAEHNDLNNLCAYFELTKYFKSIHGSPIKKDKLIENLIVQYNYNKEEIILIGDSINDYNASKKNDIKFYGYNNERLKSFTYIESFKEFLL